LPSGRSVKFKDLSETRTIQLPPMPIYHARSSWRHGAQTSARVKHWRSPASESFPLAFSRETSRPVEWSRRGDARHLDTTSVPSSRGGPGRKNRATNASCAESPGGSQSHANSETFVARELELQLSILWRPRSGGARSERRWGGRVREARASARLRRGTPRDELRHRAGS
jgi:hypothetical protein